MSEHTKGPWTKFSDFILDKDGNRISQLFNYTEEDFKNKEANSSRIIECVNGYDALLDRIAELEKEAATKEKFSLTVADMMTRQIHAMQAAVIASRTYDAEAGMTWIENTLCGPGHLPDVNEENAQEFFDKKIKELEEFRSK